MTETIEKPLTASPIGEAVIINEEIYESLLTMFSSSDEENHLMGRLILNTCDIKKSIYWIWKLSKKGWHIANRMVYLRTKASRTFRDLSRLYYISGKDAREFAKWLINEKWMTQEIYQYLETDILKLTFSQCKNSFYDVTISIKDEYKDLAKHQGQLTNNIIQ